jgi:hypothetical protein
MEYKKHFDTHIMVDSPLQLEAFEAIIDELHAVREACGVDANEVEVLIINSMCGGDEMITVRMREVKGDA